MTKYIWYDNLKLAVFPEVYEPAEDSFLLAEFSTNFKGDFVLDLGSGCGILAILSALKGAKRVLAIDINPHAARCTAHNASLCECSDVLDVICCDMLSAIRDGVRFDVVIFNPPYLPVNDNGLLGKAWSCGEKGEVILDFLTLIPRYLRESSKILMLVSSLLDLDKFLRKAFEKHLRVVLLRIKKIAWEHLLVLELSLRT